MVLVLGDLQMRICFFFFGFKEKSSIDVFSSITNFVCNFIIFVSFYFSIFHLPSYLSIKPKLDWLGKLYFCSFRFFFFTSLLFDNNKLYTQLTTVEMRWNFWNVWMLKWVKMNSRNDVCFAQIHSQYFLFVYEFFLFFFLLLFFVHIYLL